MELVDVKVTYLEMLAPNGRQVPAPREGLLVLHVKQPSVAYYRYLYHAVGAEYHWLSRRRMSDAQLATILSDPDNELHVLHVDGSPAGLAELGRRDDEVEILQFGLMKEYFGQGLGKYFLQWTHDLAWSYRPRRFWLHTCSLDHAHAIPNYQKAGFVLYKEVMIQREL